MCIEGLRSKQPSISQWLRNCGCGQQVWDNPGSPTYMVDANCNRPGKILPQNKNSCRQKFHLVSIMKLLPVNTSTRLQEIVVGNHNDLIKSFLKNLDQSINRNHELTKKYITYHTIAGKLRAYVKT